MKKMKKIAYFIIFFGLISFTSCFFNRSCENDVEEARSFYKDTALMYLWRLPDESIKVEEYPDSMYMAFKPNGDFDRKGEMKYLNFYRVWYNKKDSIYTIHCSNWYPVDGLYHTYKIQDDTLNLYFTNLTTHKIDSVRLVKVLKYY